MDDLKTEIGRLRDRVRDLQPGVVEEAAERAAPFLAKLAGIMELARPVLPLLRDGAAGFRQGSARRASSRRGPEPASVAAPVAAPAIDQDWRWRRPSWFARHKLITAAVPFAAGMGVMYAILRVLPRLDRGR